MICKVCKRPVADPEGAYAFKTGGQVRFHTHQECRDLIHSSGVALGHMARKLIEIRNPGLFESPMVRSALAVIKELRK